MAKNKFNGALLREKRMELGLSQLELANKVNSRYGVSIVDVTTISRWEINPNAVPRNNKLVKVATVLGCKMEELYEDKNFLQEEVLAMEKWIDKLTKDNKEVYISEISDGKVDDDALTLLMKSWRTSFMPGANVKEYEGGEYANNIYKKLGWEQKKFDVICSTWNTYVALLVTYAQDSNIKYTDFNVKIDKVMYQYSEGKHLGYWYKHGGKEMVASLYKHNKIYPEESSYYSKFLDDKNVHSKFAKKIAEEISGIPKLSASCHCVANYMPCPDDAGKEYNSVKGFLPDVRDYLPLMVDKIQKCVSENTELKYVKDSKEFEIPYGVIKNWHEFFLENRRSFFLEEFYYVDKKDNKDILVGIPLFRGQSLENPMPNNLNEAKECLDNILHIIQNRALKMACFLEHNDKGKIKK